MQLAYTFSSRTRGADSPRGVLPYDQTLLAPTRTGFDFFLNSSARKDKIEKFNQCVIVLKITMADLLLA